MINPLRASGRSTRLLSHAIAQAAQKKKVYVLYENPEHGKMMQRQCAKMCQGNIAGSIVYKPDAWASGVIVFETEKNMVIDWDSMTLPYNHTDCVLLVDHYAIESRFKALLAMLHQFDPHTLPTV